MKGLHGTWASIHVRFDYNAHDAVLQSLWSSGGGVGGAEVGTLMDATPLPPFGFGRGPTQRRGGVQGVVYYRGWYTAGW